MRKIHNLLFLIILSFFVITACSNSDSNNDSTSGDSTSGNLALNMGANGASSSSYEGNDEEECDSESVGPMEDDPDNLNDTDSETEDNENNTDSETEDDENYSLIVELPEADETKVASFSNVYEYPTIWGERAQAKGIATYLDYSDENGTEREQTSIWTIGSGSQMEGEVQFVQSHNIGFKWNWASQEGEQANGWGPRPDLIPFKDALLIFVPKNDIFQEITVIPMKDGKELDRISMNPPYRISYADNPDTSVHLAFSEKAWSVMMEADYMDPEVSFKFIGTAEGGAEYDVTLSNRWESEDDSGQNIVYSAPAEITLFFIQLGMLTNYPTSGSYPMLTDSIDAANEYFQTIPFAKLVNAAYEPRSLDVVILDNGTIYDTSGVRGQTVSASTNAGWYYGDMRESVAKKTVSSGINLANRGVPASAIVQSNQISGSDPFIMTIHHARGYYSNGYANHGYSGGDGIGTLAGSTGNEFSHEVGHAFGMSHLTGDSNADKGVHTRYSSWGYDAYKNRMRANVDWSKSKGNTYFADLYPYNTDSMNGGLANSGISRYTHNTAYSTYDIQNTQETRYMLGLNDDGTYGYFKWDFTNYKYVQATFPEQEDEFNIQKRRNPSKIGVPVITILAGYDPNQTANTPNYAVMYPYFRGNYGIVYDELFIDEAPSNGYYFKIEYYDGTVKYVALPDSRIDSSKVNKAHVNIPESDAPKKVTLITNNGYIAKYDDGIEIENSTTIPEDLDPMNEVVIIGRDKDNKYDYNQVLARDINLLNTQLESEDVETYEMTDTQKEIASYLNHRKMLNRLNDNAYNIIAKYFTQLQAYNEVEAYLNSNYSALEKGDTEALKGLYEITSDFNVGNLGEINWGLFKHHNPTYGECLSISTTSTTYDNGYLVQYASCQENDDKFLFFMDAIKRIHPKIAPSYCLNGEDPKRLDLCSDDDNQKWDMIHGNAGYEQYVQYKNIGTGKCISKDANWKPVASGCASYNTDNLAERLPFNNWQTLYEVNNSDTIMVDPGDLPSWFAEEVSKYLINYISSAN